MCFRVCRRVFGLMWIYTSIDIYRPIFSEMYTQLHSANYVYSIIGKPNCLPCNPHQFYILLIRDIQHYFSWSEIKMLLYVVIFLLYAGDTIFFNRLEIVITHLFFTHVTPYLKLRHLFPADFLDLSLKHSCEMLMPNPVPNSDGILCRSFWRSLYFGYSLNTKFTPNAIES